MIEEIERIRTNDKLNICIIGGGNIGTLLLGDLGKKDNVVINLYTSNTTKWSKDIEVYDTFEKLKHTSHIDTISNDPNIVIREADIIISTLPSQVFPNILKEISPYIKHNTWIGVMPGSGGVEFYCNELINKGCILFGFQRVHGIARVKEYGKSVYDLGKKDTLYIATIPKDKNIEVCKNLRSY